MVLRRLYSAGGVSRTAIALATASTLLANTATIRAQDEPEALARVILEETGVRGGLVVVVGCSEAKLPAALGSDSTYLVHALDRDPKRVARAREETEAAGLYGRVSVESWSGSRLPYADELVSLLVTDQPEQLTAVEVNRVLSPGGVAYVKRAGQWRRSIKPKPTDTDEWTHLLHDATNNAVAQDRRVGPPHRLQWIAEPLNTRHHEHLASVSVVVSGGGRLFYIIDEAPALSMSLRPQWHLVARNAYNGLLLWKRRIPTWESYLRAFRSGPPEIGRRLVAGPEAVYVTLGFRAPVSALDPATGETIRTFAGTENAQEILYSNRALYVVAGRTDEEQESRRVIAVDASSGELLWWRTDLKPLPMSLAVSGDRAYLLDARGEIVCVDANTGQDVWRHHRPVPAQRPTFSSPTLVVAEDVLLCADRVVAETDNTDPHTGERIPAWLAEGGGVGELTAFSAETGTRLWSCSCAEAYHSAFDVLVTDGLVWVGQTRSRNKADFDEGRDLVTGEVKRKLDTTKAFQTTMPHHRCHRNRATSRYILMGRTGVEFIDVQTGESFRHHWTRGTCQFGTLPCNGMLYVPPHSCACYIEAKLTGFLALAPREDQEDEPSVVEKGDTRLTRGPAYGAPLSKDESSETQWPTYRHDNARSATTKTPVVPDLKPIWVAELGARPTAPVVASGRVYVACPETYTLHALSAETGRFLWRFTTGGRIDSPPTVSNGRVVFGSADGYVYCLQASDGALVWRFRAAPLDRRIIAMGRLESVWPVHGATLVRDESVYVVAGRSSYLDGGLHLYRLNLATGATLAQRTIYSRDPETGEQPDEPIMFEMPGALPDVLSMDGNRVYMRHLAFDPQTLETRQPRAHLYSPSGFLNNDWWHRTYWILGSHFYSGYIGWYFAGREVPAGRLLVVDDASVCGFGYKPAFYRGSTERQYHLFALDRAKQRAQPAPDYERANREYGPAGEGRTYVQLRWSRDVSLLVRAMVRAGDVLFIAGPPEKALRSHLAFEGKDGSILQAVSALTGDTLSEFRFDSLPVFDGMATADGRLYLATQDGRLLCAGESARPDAAVFLQPPPAEGQGPKRTPREPGLVGEWNLEEGAGELATDTSGLGNHGEVYGAWAKGEFGYCLRLEGEPGALILPDGPYLHFGTDDFSLSCWLKPDYYDARIMGKELFPTTWWVINLLADGRAELVLGQTNAEGKTVRPTTQTALPTDSWTHLAFVVDRHRREVRWFVNGALDSITKIPATLTGSLSVEGADLRIPSAYKPLEGLFDELRIYRRTLSDSEVRAAYTSGKGRHSSVQYEITW